MNGAKRSEASSIEPTPKAKPRGGEAIGSPEVTQGLIMENGGQGELERFRVV